MGFDFAPLDIPSDLVPWRTHLLGNGLVHDDGKGGIEGGVIGEHVGSSCDQVVDLDIGLQQGKASGSFCGGLSQGIIVPERDIVGHGKCKSCQQSFNRQACKQVLHLGEDCFGGKLLIF